MRKTFKGKVFGYDGYLSPFTWRYGSAEMRSIFSEEERRTTWRKVWEALADAQHGLGLISQSEMDDIRKKADRKNIDIPKAHALERSIRHDLMAELSVFAAQAKVGGGKLHLGATSADVEDNADILLCTRAIDIVLSRLLRCLREAREKVLKYRNTVCIGWTHLQPAEPTTLGYRFANYAQDLVMDVELVEMVREKFLLGKGVKGAVGTSASFNVLLGSDARVRKLERAVMDRLGLKSFEVTTQTYPRKVDYILLSCLAFIAVSCHKFGLDLRILQSPGFGELTEPVADWQVGSSAMPFKRNPVSSEKMCSLARLVSAMPTVAFANAASSVLERTLDDSAARRIVIPEAFLAIDECLTIYETLLKGLRVHPAMIQRNLERYGPFAGTEAIMMELTKRGENRQRAHETIRRISSSAWEEVAKGRPNPIEGLLAKDRAVSSKLKAEELKELMYPNRYVGNAMRKCEDFVKNTLDPILARHGRSPTKARTRR